VIASISRLIGIARTPAVETLDLHELGQEMLHLWHDGQVKMMAYRKAHPELPVHDVRYKDLVASPVEAVRGIYAFADLDFTARAQTEIRHWLADNPADKHGRHSYSLADYGISEDHIREVYADYIDTYRDYL